MQVAEITMLFRQRVSQSRPIKRKCRGNWDLLNSARKTKKGRLHWKESNGQKETKESETEMG